MSNQELLPGNQIQAVTPTSARGTVPLVHVSPSLNAAFLRSRFHLARTRPGVRLAERTGAIEGLSQAMDGIIPGLAAMPVPGGVGYGFFYEPAFRRAFAGGTAITLGYVCPAMVGGNLSSELYITCTNRAAKGVEALVAWDPGNQVCFKVFDWSRPANQQWVVDIGTAAILPYMISEQISGAPHPVLLVNNITVLTGVDTWQNQVEVYNPATSSWQNVYASDYYQAPAREQNGSTGEFVGAWGPIVETFQPSFSGTNPIGVVRTALRGADTAGNWSAWAPLAPTQSTLQTENVGFHPAALAPNHDWLVVS